MLLKLGSVGPSKVQGPMWLLIALASHPTLSCSATPVIGRRLSSCVAFSKSPYGQNQNDSSQWWYFGSGSPSVERPASLGLCFRRVCKTVFSSQVVYSLSHCFFFQLTLCLLYMSFCFDLYFWFYIAENCSDMSFYDLISTSMGHQLSGQRKVDGSMLIKAPGQAGHLKS